MPLFKFQGLPIVTSDWHVCGLAALRCETGMCMFHLRTRRWEEARISMEILGFPQVQNHTSWNGRGDVDLFTKSCEGLACFDTTVRYQAPGADMEYEGLT